MDQPPAPTKRLTLKISSLPNSTSSITAGTPSRTTPAATTPAGSPPPQTPGGSSTKIKLVRPTPTSIMRSAGGSSAVDGAKSAVETPNVAKVKIAKPTKTSPKKRAKPAEDDDDDVPLANGTSSQPQRKKTKITLIKTPQAYKPPILKTTKPTLKVKQVGKIPTRPLGEGYDSEAEDREPDPVIEEQFILRMMKGEHLDYLRDCVRKRAIGIPESQHGARIELKFLDEQGRRAVLKIEDQHFAAILLDLPTITEGMKTWDKKSMVKSADICQMMLVFAKVKSEEEAKTAPLPKAVDHGHRWPHGITPPMHDARNRRFRKRLSKLEIQNKEAEVERLLAADRDAVNTKYEFFDERQELTAAAESGDEYEEEEDEEDADAEGEADDYFGDADADGEQDAHDQSYDDALLEAEFMDALETPAEATDLATPAVGGTDAVTPLTANTGTPAAQTDDSGAEAAGGAGAEEEEDSGDYDEDDDEDGDDDDMDGDGDEDRHDEVAGVRNEIAQLKKQLTESQEQYSKMTQVLMKKRLETKIKNIKAEIKLKQSSIGEDDDD